MLWKIIISIWKKFINIDDAWFFRGTSAFHRNTSLSFINGDLLILLPLFLAILSLGIFSVKLMLLALGSFISVRYLGEMIYWIVEQKKPAKDKTSRPYDFDLKELNNHAIYIIYQTIATAWITFGVAIVFYTLLYIK